MEKNSEIHLVGLTGNSVQVNVGTNSIPARIMHIGKVESHLKGKPFAVAKNGRKQFLMFGSGMIQPVEDAEKSTQKVKKVTAFITLEVFPNTRIFVLI